MWCLSPVQAVDAITGGMKSVPTGQRSTCPTIGFRVPPSTVFLPPGTHSYDYPAPSAAAGGCNGYFANTV